MKTINFLTELEHSANLETLKIGLQNIGIKSFTIDYETQRISIMNPDDISVGSIDCAVRKAGFKCSCFTICQKNKNH